MPTNTQNTNNGGTTLALPPGFSTERNPFYAEALTRRFDTLQPRSGAVRVLLVAWKEAANEAVRELLGSPRFALKRKAPWVFEATLLPQDMEGKIAENVGTGKLFRWVDLGTRLFGVAVEGPEDLATIAVSTGLPEDEATRKLKSFGFTPTPGAMPADEDPDEWVNPDEGLIVGTIPGAKIYDLVLWEKATAIEVRGIEKAGTKG